MRVGQILDIVWKEVIVHKGTNLDEGKNLLTSLPKPTAWNNALLFWSY